MSRTPRQRRPRNQRAIRESLGQILLGFELFVVFLGTLLIFSTRTLDAVTSFVVGGFFLVLMVATIGLLRYRWGLWLGWAIQILLFLAGFIHPSMFFAGGIFLIAWAYCMWKGGEIDRARAPIIAEYRRALAAGEIDEAGNPLGAAGGQASTASAP